MRESAKHPFGSHPENGFRCCAQWLKKSDGQRHWHSLKASPTTHFTNYKGKDNSSMEQNTALWPREWSLFHHSRDTWHDEPSDGKHPKNSYLASQVSLPKARHWSPTGRNPDTNPNGGVAYQVTSLLKTTNSKEWRQTRSRSALKHRATQPSFAIKGIIIGTAGKIHIRSKY